NIFIAAQRFIHFWQFPSKIDQVAVTLLPIIEKRKIFNQSLNIIIGHTCDIKPPDISNKDDFLFLMHKKPILSYIGLAQALRTCLDCEEEKININRFIRL